MENALIQMCKAIKENEDHRKAELVQQAQQLSKDFDYTKSVEWNIWSFNFRDFDDLLMFCEQFKDPSEDIAVSVYLSAAQKIRTINLLSGTDLGINNRWKSVDWANIVQDYARTANIEQEVSEAAFVIAAVKKGFRVHMPYAGTRNKLAFKYWFNLPGKTDIDKVLSQKDKKKVGRPNTGKALSSTERSRIARAKKNEGKVKLSDEEKKAKVREQNRLRAAKLREKKALQK